MRSKPEVPHYGTPSQQRVARHWTAFSRLPLRVDDAQLGESLRTSKVKSAVYGFGLAARTQSVMIMSQRLE
jgi:hypothetical protein